MLDRRQRDVLRAEAVEPLQNLGVIAEVVAAERWEDARRMSDFTAGLTGLLDDLGWPQESRREEFRASSPSTRSTGSSPHVQPGMYADTDREMLLTAVMTGMRKGELVALRWRDVDWTANRIRVRRNFSRGEFTTPKSRRGRRSMPMTGELGAALRDLYDRSRRRRPDDLVFGHPETGEVQPKANMTRRLRAYLVAAGLDESHCFHDLRHTFGTLMAAAGVPMRTLQEWMGHRDISTTQKYADYAPSPHEGEMVNAAFAREQPTPPARPQLALVEA